MSNYIQTSQNQSPYDAKVDSNPTPDLPFYRNEEKIPEEFKLSTTDQVGGGGTSVYETITNSSTNNYYTNTYVTGGSGGAKSVTFIVGPQSNSDSSSYDYATDGTADNVQIQAAIDALPSTGGTVLLREGTYTLAGDVSSNKSGVSIVGVGRGTIIRPVSGLTDYLLNLTGNYTRVESIYFDGNSGTGTVIAILIGGQSPIIRNCQFVNLSSSCIVGAMSSYDEEGIIEGCYFDNWDATVSGKIAVLDFVGTINDCVFKGTSTDGIFISGNDACSLVNSFLLIPNLFAAIVVENIINITSNHFLFSGTTFDGTSIIVFSSRNISGNYFDLSASGVASTTSAGAIVIEGNSVHVSGNYIDGGSGPYAIELGDGSMVIGNTINNYGGHGIIVSGSGDHGVISENLIKNVGQADSSAYSGIFLGDGSGNTRWVVSGNRIYSESTTTKKMQYGIRETASSSDFNVIVNNIVSSASSAQISIQGANTLAANNLTD